MYPPFQTSTASARSPRNSKTRSLRSATPASLTTTTATCQSFGMTPGLSSGLMPTLSLRRITPTGRRTFTAISLRRRIIPSSLALRPTLDVTLTLLAPSSTRLARVDFITSSSRCRVSIPS
ncbi:hypothetical protein FOCG_18591 [Fusarium oxysporum f. sp. radicis-lycopersici 26381]|nr:hypothetical protein FOCG_18591 [Fusarium oxysporum f. sp. radicis-lycopersici 26381]